MRLRIMETVAASSASLRATIWLAAGSRTAAGPLRAGARAAGALLDATESRSGHLTMGLRAISIPEECRASGASGRLR
jgi:hypothetical protein